MKIKNDGHVRKVGLVGRYSDAVTLEEPDLFLRRTSISTPRSTPKTNDNTCLHKHSNKCSLRHYSKSQKVEAT